MRIKFVSGRIILTALILIFLFIPLVLARLAPGSNDWGVFEIIGNAYFYFICFPLGYILNFMDMPSASFTSDATFLIALFIDIIINSIILNNAYDLIKQRLTTINNEQ